MQGNRTVSGLAGAQIGGSLASQANQQVAAAAFADNLRANQMASAPRAIGVLDLIGDAHQSVTDLVSTFGALEQRLGGVLRSSCEKEGCNSTQCVSSDSQSVEMLRNLIVRIAGVTEMVEMLHDRVQV